MFPLNLAEQGQGRGFRDFYLCKLAREGLWGVENDYPVVCGSADELGVIVVFCPIEVGFFLLRPSTRTLTVLL